MLRHLVTAMGLTAVLSASALAVPDFFDDMETGATAWSAWPTADQPLSLVQVDAGGVERARSGGAITAHACGGGEGAGALKQLAADVGSPESYASYADFGATTGPVFAEVFVYDKRFNDGTNPSEPVVNGLALVGASANPADETDLLEIGILPAGPGGSTAYSMRTQADGFAATTTTVPRKTGFTRLVIEADGLAEGGQVRFYIDIDGAMIEVGTSQRMPGVALQFVRIGGTSPGYEDFWYDDVKVIEQHFPKVTFFDDFEVGVRTARWPIWPTSDALDRLEGGCAHNITPYGYRSALVVESDPAGYASYADFGATSGAVRSEVWVYDPFDDDGTDKDRPVSIMLALIGEAEPPDQGEEWNWTDYLQLAAIAWYQPGGLSSHYYVRTMYNDDNNLGFIPTGVPRRQGWIKLGIEADGIAQGGEARFYIDDVLVVTSQRRCPVRLQYVRLGVNFKSYDHIWYDDVIVDAEPTTCHPVRFDADGDGTVDQTDFAAFQRCINPTGPVTDCSVCYCMDGNADGRIDIDDFEDFLDCYSGAAILADPDCDAGLPDR